MPIEFLTDSQKKYYGRFAAEPSREELARYFHFDDTDRSLINKRRGDHNRLGIALQLGTVRFLGTFLANPIDVPDGVKTFVCQQLNIKSTSSLPRYMVREATRLEHTAIIRLHYNYFDFNDSPWRFRLGRWLYTRSWISNERPSLMFDMATDWLIGNKVLLPGATTLERLVSQIRDRTANRLWRYLSNLPTAAQKDALHELLNIQEGSQVSALERFRQGPVNISGPSFNNALARYQSLHKFGIYNLDVLYAPPIRLKNIARHASQISAYKIARMPEDRRIATLVAFVHTHEIIALDEG